MAVDAVLLRVEEAARVLSIGRSKTYAMIASGQLPSVQVGRRSLRVPADALHAWVEHLLRLTEASEAVGDSGASRDGAKTEKAPEWS